MDEPVEERNNTMSAENMVGPENAVGDGKVSLRAYCIWKLRGGEGAAPADLPEDEVARADDWLARVDGLSAEARYLLWKNERRDGLAYDDLKQRALALADELGFRGTERGCVGARVFVPFTRALQGVAPWKWTTLPPQDADKEALLGQIQKLAGWESEPPEVLEGLRRTFDERYPGDQNLRKRAEENGWLFQIVKRRAYGFGSRQGGGQALQRYLAGARIPENVQDPLWKAFDKGVAKRLQHAGANSASKPPPPARRGIVPGAAMARANQAAIPADLAEEGATSGGLSGDGIHPNSIPNLRPAKKWTIYGDESGSRFQNPAGSGTAGRYVFVLVPDGADLPALPAGWHSVERSLEENVAAARALRRSECGVLGIPVSALPPSNRSLWFPSIQELLEMALGLLPLDGETEVELVVEQRGTANAGNAVLLGQMLDIVMWRLAQAAPERAKVLHVTGRFAGKDEEGPGGYADVVAYSWGCEPGKRRAFEEFGWVGPCLVAEDGETASAFRRCFEMLRQGGRLPPSDWSVLVSCREAAAVGSLVGALLQECGKVARKGADLWRTYLDHTVGHLASNAIRMDLLQRQIAWLKEWEPDAERIPPRLRLLWLTAQLAESNHHGGTRFGQEEHEREFAELSRRLKDEDAPLCCCAALHLAVELTDAFRFEDAREVLRPWAEETVAVPGLFYHAQVLSSLGQHAAFLGRNEEALALFDRALESFRRLSDVKEDECGHTLAYAVTAAMDAQSPKLEEFWEQYLRSLGVREAFPGDVARRFAGLGGDTPKLKYAHVIFLRWIAELPPEHPARQAYTELAGEWKWTGSDHPWELIAFYRALLIGEGSEAGQWWFRWGHELAWHGGPTLKAIALVLGAGLMAGGAISSEAYLAEVEEVERLLPELGHERMAALRKQAEKPLGPLELAKKVLPFNFR